MKIKTDTGEEFDFDLPAEFETLQRFCAQYIEISERIRQSPRLRLQLHAALEPEPEFKGTDDLE